MVFKILKYLIVLFAVCTHPYLSPFTSSYKYKNTIKVYKIIMKLIIVVEIDRRVCKLIRRTACIEHEV